MNFLLSHNDMDGYGCNITALLIDPDTRYINTGYDSIVENLQYFYNTVAPEGVITTFYITDLNFGEIETIELYRIVKNFPNIEIIYVDHHPYKCEKQIKIFTKMKEFNNFTLVHTEKFSASYIFYKYAVKKGLLDSTDDLDYLMSCIDAYDTWKDKSDLFTHGMGMNDFFYSCGANKNKFSYYLIKHGKITDEIYKFMGEFVIEKDAHFKAIQEQGLIVPFGKTLMVISDKYISYMTIDFPDYDFYVNGRSYGGVSVRVSSHVDINVANTVIEGLTELMMTNPYIRGAGGHERAIGITLEKEHKDKMISIVEQSIKYIVSNHKD